MTSFAASLRVAGAAFRNRAIRSVLLAFFAFNAVELGAWTAILVYAYDATGPASVGIVAVAQLLPSALLAPFLAALGDRFPRGRLLAGWYVAQAAALLVTGLAIVGGAPALAVYVVSMVATITMTQTRPLQAALLPDLAESPDELTAANALASTAEGVGGLVGPLVVGLILSGSTTAAAFLAMGAALLIAGCLPLLLDRRIVGAPDRSAGAGAGAETRDRGEGGSAGDVGPSDEDAGSSLGLFDGLRLIARDRDVLVVVAMLTGRLVIFGGLEVMIVLIAIDLLGMDDAGAGYLAAAMGVGIIVGSATTISLVGRRRLARWLGFAAVMVGIPVALIGIGPAPASTAILLVLVGIGLAVLDVAGQTSLQRITPDDLRARVFGALEGLQLIGEALGSLLIVPIVVLFGLDVALILLGLLLPALALLSVRRFTSIDARVVLPTRELAVVRAVPMFSALRPAILESLARHLESIVAPAGTVVIREGDPGDRFYIVEAGEVAVTVAGDSRPSLGPGATFGEIALLRDVPRTASVIATTDVRLWALDRAEFLAAVTGSMPALQEAERLASVRLG